MLVGSAQALAFLGALLGSCGHKDKVLHLLSNPLHPGNHHIIYYVLCSPSPGDDR